MPRSSGCVIWVVGAALLALLLCGAALLVLLDAFKPWGGVGLALVLVLIAGGLLVLAREPLRAVVRLWLTGALVSFAISLTHLTIAADSQTTMVLQTGVCLLVLAVVRTRLPVGQAGLPLAAQVWLSLVSALVLGLPWVVLGALGSWFDMVLALLNAALLGVIAVVPAEPVLRAVPHPGMVMGVWLLLLAWPFGADGVGLLLVLLLPLLGWVGARMLLRGEGPAVVVLIGLTAAWPLLFADPDTLAPELLFGGTEGLFWALLAALVSAALVLPITLVLQRPVSLRMPWPPIMVASVALVALLVYVQIGQPGWYGDRLFVILKDQADLRSEAGIRSFDERRVAVYRTLTTHADTTQVALRRDLGVLGVAVTPYYLVNALEVRGDWPVRLWLLTRPEVDRILPNPVLRPLPVVQAAESGWQDAPEQLPWNLAMIGADRAWREFGVRGEGIVIGQSDTGVDVNHPELYDGYAGVRADGTLDHAYHWFDPWNGRPAPYDDAGHGTHTLAIALGRAVGVAPGASWIGCVNLARNIGNAARYLDCLQFMLAPFPPGGNPLRDGDPLRSAHILNNSWGCPQNLEGCDPNALLPAVHALRVAGLFVVASAGNDGPACHTVADPMALYADVFTVGAVDRDAALTSFSSVGPVLADGSGRIKPDLVAPGQGVLSASSGGGYMAASGTSQAGPHVVGAVALMWAANPRLIGDVARTEQILRAAAIPLPHAAAGLPVDACAHNLDVGQTPNAAVGSGLLDVYRAVQLARMLP